MTRCHNARPPSPRTGQLPAVPTEYASPPAGPTGDKGAWAQQWQRSTINSTSLARISSRFRFFISSLMYSSLISRNPRYFSFSFSNLYKSVVPAGSSAPSCSLNRCERQGGAPGIADNPPWHQRPLSRRRPWPRRSPCPPSSQSTAEFQQKEKRFAGCFLRSGGRREV